MVQHMPHSSSAAGGSPLIIHQSDIPSTSTTRSMEEEASVVQAMIESAESVEPTVAGLVAASEIESAAVTSIAEQVEEIAKTEVVH